jgi:uncharacterized membrane protein (UPF0127 family)
MPSKGKYELTNPAKKKSVMVELEVADTEFSRMRGLMFRDSIVPILFIFGFDGTFSIHSYFVKGEFDAVYLERDGRVTEIIRRIPPNTALVRPKKISSMLLELPVKTTDALCIEEGDVLRWKRLGGG